ncbi:MAG: hypothetical protein Q8N51_09680 [Gammaproteobacteria bacterium]|nr:hypothetical protein [Gammaproteobacteria bacterium]
MRTFPFHQDDGGRANSRRPRQQNDCAVRACAIATGLPYDQVYDELAAMGRRCGRGTSRKILASWLKPHATYHAYPSIAGQPRKHVDTFLAGPGAQGRWVVRIAGHVTAVIDGVAHDLTAPLADACVYCAWRIND